MATAMNNDTHRKKRAGLALAFLTTIFIVYLFAAGQVSKEISQSDLLAIQKLHVDLQCHTISSFQDELSCIQAIQGSIKTLVPNMNCAARGQTIEPFEFLQRQYGCCYDRARYTEKALSRYQFKTRHVAIYDMSDYGVFGLFMPGTLSHATTEVYTQKGWMGVDSNEPFVLITRSNQVLSYKDFKQHPYTLKYPVEPRNFYSKNLLVVYGLFSRHGMFHGPNLPAPEFNFRELFYNF
jgi:hypothetical protein